MERYQQHGRCTKCNYDNVSTNFQGAGTWVWIGHGKGWMSFGTDVMRRKCKRCGWTWVEATFDTETKEEFSDKKT